ncbi:MAG TPA: glycosyltransferase [Vicinamibacterales bacterium]|nr:glycosyltransferase [Vicinamibacterales bacterium]
MTVVHVSAYFAPAWGFGGPPRSLLSLCQAQQAAGLAVEVFTTTANVGVELPPAPDGLMVEGVRVRRFPLAVPRSMFGAPSMADALAEAAAGATVLHLHGLFNRTIWLAAGAARRAGTPVVLSPRGMLNPAALAHHAWRKRAAWTLFDRRVVHDATILHATSPDERDTLVRVAGSARVAHIPHGVSLEPRDRDGRAVREWCEIPVDARYLLFLGRLHRIKRLDLVAGTFMRLAEAHPDLHLVMAGPDEQNQRPAIEAQLGSLGSRVRWTGTVEGPLKTAVLEEAATLLLCSDAESFGLVVAESLAAGTPPVVTRTCPWALLEEERCGRWVAQTAAAMSDAVAESLASPSIRAQRSMRAREVAARHFAWPPIARQFASCYAEIGRADRLSVA